MTVLSLRQPTAAGVVFGKVSRVSVSLPENVLPPANNDPVDGWRPMFIHASDGPLSDANDASGTEIDRKFQKLLGMIVCHRMQLCAGYALLDFRSPMVFREPRYFRMTGTLAEYLGETDDMRQLIERAMTPAAWRGRTSTPAGPIDTSGD